MKNIIVFLLIFMIIFSFSFVVTSAESTTFVGLVMGDVDCNNRVSVVDATYIQRHSAKMIKLSTSQQLCADVSGDKNITIIDATIIQRYLVKLSYDGKVNIPCEVGQTTSEIVYETKIDGYWQLINDTQIVEVDSEGCSGKRTNLLSVKEGDRFDYNGKGQYYVPSVIWFDSNGDFLSMEQYVGKTIFTAPINCKYAQFFSFEYNLNSVLEVRYIQENDKTSVLYGKKIIYDGDSICESRDYSPTGSYANYSNGGAYAKIISEITGGVYENFAKGGAGLRANKENETHHSIVDNLVNLPTDGDLYCFQGGINDYWRNATLGSYSPYDYNSELDTTTICGALEYIFRYSLDNFKGKPIVFVITHKVGNTAFSENSQGDTFEDYHDVMVGICEKYSIPYYDAFLNSGLNGWNQTQNDLFLTSNETGKGDGCHPNEEGYKRYYVPQLISIFESVMPVE